jgi:hypothetical protein
MRRVLVKKRSKILNFIYESVKNLYAAGVIDQTVMREVTQACLPPSTRPRRARGGFHGRPATPRERKLYEEG